jgi:hypothetical protein
MADEKNNKGTGQSTEEKTAVAGGIALLVIVILLVAWGFFFIRKIQKGNQQLEFGGTAQDEFNFSTVRDAQAEIENTFQYTEEELRALRDSAVSRQLPPTTGGSTSGEDKPFGVPGDDSF